jgi:hypothetical protein
MMGNPDERRGRSARQCGPGIVSKRPMRLFIEKARAISADDESSAADELLAQLARAPLKLHIKPKKP